MRTNHQEMGEHIGLMSNGLWLIVIHPISSESRISSIYIYIYYRILYIHIYRNPLFNQWIFALIDPLLSNIYIYIL